MMIYLTFGWFFITNYSVNVDLLSLIKSSNPNDIGFGSNDFQAKKKRTEFNWIYSMSDICSIPWDFYNLIRSKQKKKTNLILRKIKQTNKKNAKKIICVLVIYNAARLYNICMYGKTINSKCAWKVDLRI